MQSYTSSLSFERLSRRLLATTCLTVAGGVGLQAGTINETTDFPNFPDGTLLPLGTTVVNGNVNCLVDDCEDWFEFQGLLPGSAFTLVVDQPGFFFYGGSAAFETNGNFIDGAGFEEGLAILGGIVPADGRVRVVVGNDFEEGGGAYSATLTADTVPEPATLAPAALALAGALAWRRKKQVN